MMRLIRCRRIGGSAIETRRCTPGTTMAAALAASLAVLAIGGLSWFAPIGAVLAQTPGTAGQTLFDVFGGGDSVDPRADGLAKLAAAIRQAKAPRECALGELTIYVPKGDPLFQKALSSARRDILLRALEGQGLGVAGRLLVKEESGSLGKFDVGYTPPRDDKPPTLRTTSVPPKGSKVKAGQMIKVTMVARDDADQWQTGIKTIQLVADSDSGRFVASENYAPCADPREKRVEATYEVPANPPPIVRLTALAEDHAGLMDTDVGEFPTGDWYGTIDWRIPAPFSRHWGRLDLTFDYDGRGNLTGRMAGDSYVESPARGEFCGMTTQTPAKLSANLAGQYTPGRNAMSLRVADPHAEQGQFSMCAIGPDGGPLRMSGQPFGGSGPLGQPGLAQLLSSLTVRADGSVEASGEWPVTPASPTPTTLHLKLTLHRAQN